MTLREKTYKFLRWSEKWTKTDMVYLTKGGFWLTLGQTTSILSAFLLSIAFANLLPKETYGTYKFVLSVFSILTIFTLPGIDTALIRSIAKGHNNSLIKTAKIKIKWGILGSIMALLLALYYYYNLNYQLTIALLLSAVFLPIMDSFNLYGSFLTSRKKFKLATKYGITTKLLATTTMLLTLWYTNNLFIVLIAYFISNTVLRLIFLLITNDRSSEKNKDNDLISYGKKLTWLNVLNNTVGQIDKILVFHYIGATELAVYSLAVLPVENIRIVFKNTNILALPKFSESNLEKIKKTIIKKIVNFIIILTFITIVYIALAPMLYKIFFPLYTDSVIYSQIFSLTLITIPLSIILAVFYSQGMTKELYKFNIFTSIFKLSILLIGIHFYGLLGMIIARVIAQFFSFSCSTLILKKS